MEVLSVDQKAANKIKENISKFKDRDMADVIIDQIGYMGNFDPSSLLFWLSKKGFNNDVLKYFMEATYA